MEKELDKQFVKNQTFHVIRNQNGINVVRIQNITVRQMVQILLVKLNAV